MTMWIRVLVLATIAMGACSRSGGDVRDAGGSGESLAMAPAPEDRVHLARAAQGPTRRRRPMRRSGRRRRTARLVMVSGKLTLGCTSPA
jgi:hypothetical protein